MKPINKTSKQIERIEVWKPKPTKKRYKIIERQTKAKSFKKWLQSTITLLHNDNKLETEQILKTILNKYNQFEEQENYIQDSWKGKSGLKFIQKPDTILVLRHQKKEKDSKPELKVAELQKEEINQMINIINKIWKLLDEKQKQKGIKTRLLAEKFSGKNWEKQIYAERNLHHKVTYILNWLEYKKMIKYSRAGFTRVINYHENLDSILNKEIQNEIN